MVLQDLNSVKTVYANGNDHGLLTTAVPTSGRPGWGARRVRSGQAAEHHLPSAGRPRLAGLRLLRQHVSRDAEHRPAVRGEREIHQRVCRLSRVLAHPRLHHDRQVSRPPAPDRLDSRPEIAGGEAPDAGVRAAVAAAGNDHRGGAEAARLPHREHRQVASGRRRLLPGEPGLRRERRRQRFAARRNPTSARSICPTCRAAPRTTT